MTIAEDKKPGGLFREEYSADALAIDRASVRSKDQDGHLSVARTPIMRACVNGYYGREIPGAKELGLDDNKLYRLLRDPEEIKKAAATSHGKPLTIVHRAQNAGDHEKSVVVGAIGTDAAFEGDYLWNALSVWDGEAIEGIENDTQKELSPGYHYRVEMAPGTFRGQAYDGVMRDIRFNHVTLVKEGRQGPTVVVHDEALDSFEEGKHPRDHGKFSASHRERGDAHKAAMEANKYDPAAWGAHKDAKFAHYEAADQHDAAREYRDRSKMHAGRNRPTLAKSDAKSYEHAAKRAAELTDLAEHYSARTKGAKTASLSERDLATDRAPFNFGAFQMKPLFSAFVLASDEKPRISFDAFEESKHPRANNGQFGAGEGKSHKEHADHHEKMALKHEDGIDKGGREGEAHMRAAEAHHAATLMHDVANRRGPDYSNNAHAASKTAHAATEATKPQKEPDVRDQVHSYAASTHRRDLENHAAMVSSHTRRAGEAFAAGRKDEAELHTKAAEAHATASTSHKGAAIAHEASSKRAGAPTLSRVAETHTRKAEEATTKVNAHNAERDRAAAIAAAKKDEGKYGAGPGKSHAEHSSHHDKAAQGHREEAGKASGESVAAHAAAAKAHSDAGHEHFRAVLGHGSSAEAHEASKAAHEASERAKKK